MDWQHIAQQDPYLAGSIAARSWEWWDETTAEQEAESVHLAGEQRDKFLQGWKAELAERSKSVKSNW